MSAKKGGDEPERSIGYLERIASLVKHPLFQFLIILCIVYLIATIFIVTRHSEVSAVVLLAGQGLVCIILGILGAAVYWGERKAEILQSTIKYKDEIEEQFKRRAREKWHEKLTKPKSPKD